MISVKKLKSKSFQINSLKKSKFKNLVLLVIVIFCFPYLIYAQDSEKKKAMKELQTAKDDTTKVFKYYTLGEFFEQENPDSALFYFEKGFELAKKLDYKRGIGSYTSFAIVVLNNRGEYLKALELTKETLEHFKKYGTKRDLCIAYTNVANEWHYLGDFEQAIQYYLKAEPIAEAINDLRMMRVANNNIAAVFLDMKDAKKGIPYAEKALVIARKMKNDYATASCLINLAVGKTLLKNYEGAVSNYNEVYAIAKKTDDKILELDSFNGIGESLRQAGKANESIKYYQKSLKLGLESQAYDYVMLAYGGMAVNYQNLEKHKEAKAAVINAINYGKKLGVKSELMDYYLDASKISSKLNESEEVLKYLELYEEIKDSVMNETKRSAIQLSEAKFQTEKKENKIKVQEAQIKQKTTNNILLIGGIIAFALLSLLVFLNYRNRLRIEKQQVLQLRQTQQLTATESIIKGQEEERSRLARDLHDGLGGLLSGIKLTLNNMTGNVILSEQNANVFNRALGQLDNAISEMRRVAHSMMPESLLKFGLVDAVNDFCEGISQSGKLKVHFLAIGTENMKLEQSEEITIYRIIQELLNNTLKHADATEAQVQIAKTEELLSITVEDNGKGFDSSQLNKNKGIGISNIENRVAYLNGKLEVRSELGKGTSTSIEIIQKS